MNMTATPWKRIMAYLIDSGIYLMPPIWFFASVSAATTLQTVLSSSLSLPMLLLVPTGVLMLQTWLTMMYGGTIGTLCMGLHIVDEHGKMLSFTHAFLRLIIANTLSMILFPVSLVWVYIDTEHRTWHDLATATKVIDLHVTTGLVVGLVAFVIVIGSAALGVQQILHNCVQNARIYQNVQTDVMTGIQMIQKRSSEQKAAPGQSNGNTSTEPIPTRAWTQ